MSFVATNSSDNTETVSFDVSGMTSGVSLLLVAPMSTTRTLTIPNATDTLVAQIAIQTLSSKTLLTDTNACYFVNAPDNTKTLQLTLAGATTNTTTTLAFVQTANRTVTFPDSSIYIQPVEYSWTIPLPLISNAGYYSTGFNQTNYGGAAYFLPTTLTASNIWFVIKTAASSSSVSVGFYQSADGTANVGSAWSRVTYATLTTTGSAGTALSSALNGAPITFKPGVVVVMWACSTASTLLMYTYTVNTTPLQSSNVPSGVLVSVFTTSTAHAATPPATLTPTTTNVTAAATNVPLLFGLD